MLFEHSFGHEQEQLLEDWWRKIPTVPAIVHAGKSLSHRPRYAKDEIGDHFGKRYLEGVSNIGIYLYKLERKASDYIGTVGSPGWEAASARHR